MSDTICAVQLIAVGQAPVGVIAIGQVPTGVVAIGQGARGVIVVGQLACGVIAVGQLAIGIVALGQLAVGGVWAGGMLGLAPVRGPALLGFGPIGELGLRDLYRLRWRRFRADRQSIVRRSLAVIIATAAVLVVWFGALSPTIDELRHDGDTEIDEPPVLR